MPPCYHTLFVDRARAEKTEPPASILEVRGHERYNRPVSGNRFYEEGEAEEILRTALRHSDAGAIDRGRLISMAAELGISEEAISRAEAHLERERGAEQKKRQDELDRLAFRRHVRSRFWADFSSYLSVNAFLIAIWYFMGGGYFWPFWVLAGWGIGVISEFIGTFFGHSHRDFERWKRKQKRRRSECASLPQPDLERYLDEISPLLEGRRIEKIKNVRERFGLGLAQAKEAVDEYESRHACK